MSGLTYIGNGAWLPEVPARDLTEDEALLHAVAIAAAAKAGHVLYESVKDAPRRATPDKTKEKGE